MFGASYWENSSGEMVDIIHLVSILQELDRGIIVLNGINDSYKAVIHFLEKTRPNCINLSYDMLLDIFKQGYEKNNGEYNCILQQYIDNVHQNGIAVIEDINYLRGRSLTATVWSEMIIHASQNHLIIVTGHDLTDEVFPILNSPSVQEWRASLQ